MSDQEIPLKGGQVNSVVRVGDTVRRATNRDMTLQHALFEHLAARHFLAAPRFLGRDAQGRDILTYLPGDVLYDKDDFSDAQLTAAAKLLRSYHDATTDFLSVTDAGAEVMCHDDWTPANTTFVDDLPHGMIDFDTISPGSRLWDVAYSTWMWLGLSEPVWSPKDQRRRLELFAASYDHPSCTPGLIAATIPTRQAGRIRFARLKGMVEAVHWAENAMDWTLEHITGWYHPDGLT